MTFLKLCLAITALGIFLSVLARVIELFRPRP
jgi:hypothetical protein